LDPFGSDHIPFIDNGLAAVLTIEGTDQANEHEHTANDTLDHINYDLMLEILRMNTAFIASELDRQE
jgi:Zn-dependent M28 family amino/carboxypeptidase